MATLSAGQVPRKPNYWEDLKAVTRVQQADGTWAEAIAALLYAWDATSSAYVQLTVDHATGGLNVKSSGGGGTGSTLNFGSGAPGAGVGADGDTYFDYTNERFYGPKASGSWPAAIAIGTHTSLGFVATPTGSTTNRGWSSTQTLHGTNPSAGGAYYGINNILVSSDDADSGTDAGYAGLQVDYTWGGAAAKGNRLGMFAYLKQTSASGNAQGYSVAGQWISQSSSGDGGTNTGAGAKGTLMAENPQVRSNGATNLYSLVVGEDDVFGTAASTQKYVFGRAFASYHINAGATLDSALVVYSGGSFSGYGPGSGFGNGLLFAELESNGLTPLRSTATILGVSTTSLSTVSVAKGIDFSKCGFSSNAMQLGSGATQFTVSSGGLLGIGMAPTGLGVEVKSATAFFPQSLLWNDNNGSSGGYMNFRSTRAGGPTQAGDTLGTLVWQGYDTGSNQQNALLFQCIAATVGASSVTARLELVSGDLYLSAGSLGATGTRVTKGWFTDLEVTNAPTVGGTSIYDVTATFTTKRITPRIGTVSSSATPTPTGDTADQYNVTALAANAVVAAPTGTPTNGQKLVLRITSDSSIRTLGWNAIYRASSDLALPTATVASKTQYLGFIYNALSTTWDLVAYLGNF